MTPFDSSADWVDSETFAEAGDIEAGLAEVIGHDVSEATPESVDRWLAESLSQLTPVESESFGKALSKLGSLKNSAVFKQFGQIAGTALPTVGTLVGTAYGGPIGAALGGSLGKAAGGALAGQSTSRPARKTARSARVGSTPAPVVGEDPGAAADPGIATEPAAEPGPATEPAAGEPGSHAAAELLYLIQNPTVIAGLLSLAMGAHGRKAMAGPDGNPLPLGAIVTLLKDRAERAAEEADAFGSDDGESTPSYLLDSAGGFRCDPSNPTERSDLLLELLERQDDELLSAAAYDASDWDQYLEQDERW